MAQRHDDGTPERDESRIGRLFARFRRARGYGGHERETVLIVLKCALAACVAWVIADTVVKADSPAFAPFSAVLMVQVTVYQSVVQSLRYVLAVTLGVVVQAVLGFLLGTHLWTFTLVALVALTISRWRRLGPQGPQVATAAFFAYSSFATVTTTYDQVTRLTEIVVLVLVGCGLGVAVNLLVLPPMRYRSAEYGITTLARAMDDLLGDMAPGLREGVPGEDRTGDWWRRARRIEGLVPQALAAVEGAQESVRFNPRRLLQRHRGASFHGYRDVVEALGRITEQLTSLTRGLYYATGTAAEDQPYPDFLAEYGDFLEGIGGATQELTELTGQRLAEQVDRLREHLDTAGEGYDRLAATVRRTSLDPAEISHAYGILLVDAARLLEELRFVQERLARSIGLAADPPTAQGEGR
ncbi:aromatic acid exporter family protein [Marinactinospora thermotolerans]|uniref:Predicted membrane protein n=1 Tax=Marinactinospora thermotolerans DSM 45154 TaxID=1122192 RepID=A0A1T4RMG3_9ACTN|nr:aromatic acid exporter family protein [Marinactinospora thermotolerans]SKA17159.1 Predicted membrane protein [Marinactinospora thermotolerans DSM 45154]